jgi:S1-C subfamily serine protease
MKIKILASLGFLILLSLFLSRFDSLPVGTANTALAQGVLESLEKNITGLVEGIKPSLVTIEAEIYPSGKKKISSLTSFVGSGVVYSSDGYILTTSSVAGGMQDFKVTLSNKKEYKAKLVGTDLQTNLAILKVDTNGLSKGRFGNSDRVKEGSWVTVVGNSYGLPTAVSFGIVNGIREDGTIQMSVNVSPGNSGGPVLNVKGEVIGLVSAKLSETSYLDFLRLYEEKEKRIISIPPTQIEIPSSGISIAIPINQVMKKTDWIIKHGSSIEKGYLGVYLEDLDYDIKKEHGIKGGVLITGVIEDSPADKAGLKDEDVVIEFNRQKVKDSDHFRKLIGDSQPEDVVKLRIIRDRDKKVLTAKLGSSGSVYSYWKEKTIIPSIKIPEINIPEIKIQYDEAKGEYDEAQAKMLEEELNKILNKSLDNFKQELKRLEKELERLNKKMVKYEEEK